MLGLIEAAFGTSQSRPQTAASGNAAAPESTTAAGAAATTARDRDAEPGVQEDPSRLDRAVEVLLTDVGYLPRVEEVSIAPLGAGLDLLEASDDAESRPSSERGRQTVAPSEPPPGGGRGPPPPSEDRLAPATERTGAGALQPQQQQQTIPPAVAVAPGISRDTARYAHHYPDDIDLVLRFTQVLSAVSPDAQRKVRHEGMYKLLLQGVRLMHLCQYEYEDVVLVMAYASVYWKYAFQFIGHKMSSTEAAHVCVLLIYLAHCFLLDETCQLRWWSKQIFKKYCSIKSLDAALFRLLKMRKYKLLISDEEQIEVLRCLRRPDSQRLTRGGGRDVPSGEQTSSSLAVEDVPQERQDARHRQVDNLATAAPTDAGSHSTRKNGEQEDCGESSNSTTAALTKDGSVDAD
mmetsp:Transcript_44429/g.81096  ORF Transcript_44429/g.81096 Transcript_44429/m.81096 type:complete len:405 (-) Transcript_44429:267-1481(-)